MMLVYIPNNVHIPRESLPESPNPHLATVESIHCMLPIRLRPLRRLHLSMIL